MTSSPSFIKVSIQRCAVCRVVVLCVVSWLGSGLVFAQGPATPGELGTSGRAEATLPLDDILRLHKERDAAVEAEGETRRERLAASPLVDGMIDRLALRGRIVDQGVKVDATVEVTVLASETWVRLPILELGSEVLITSLSDVENGSTAVVDGWLTVLAREPGKRSLDASFLVRASSQGETRRAVLKPADATVRTFDLEVDAGHFHLLEADGIASPEGFRFFPTAGRFDVRWQVRPQEAPRAEATPPPSLEPVIVAAHVSTVSTLEGEVHHRLLYDLRFEGRHALDFHLPDGLELRKVFVHRRSTAFDLQPDPELGRRLRLTVEPPQAGDRRGTVELVVVAPKETFHLSGELTFTLPSASWPVHQLYARLHLPSVFTYRWAGGSLSPADRVPEIVMTDDLPTPGDEMLFQQPFVQGSQPVLRVAYDIELEGSYFTGG